MRKTNRKTERGISLIMALLALMLLSAIAVGMMVMSSTETGVSGNFKAEETAFFAARAGLEEVRDRMLPANPNSINASLPTSLPGGANPWAQYVLANDVTMADVTNASGKMFDDELCHDFPSYFGTMDPTVPCTTIPTGAWYNPPIASVASNLAHPLEYKWVRVTLKANNSAPFPVVSPPTADQVCWSGTGNGASETVAVGTTCNALPSATPVYLLTALAVTPSGAHRIVQQELAQQPVQTLPYGLFATGGGCGALSLGGGAQTYSFDSSAENPPTNPPPYNTSGGDVGSNGNITFDGNNTAVNGTTASALSGVGNCNAGGANNGITGTPAQYGTASNIPVQTPPVPPTPNPLPPQTNQNARSLPNPLPPGAYGNLSLTGGITLTLQGGTPSSPAVYTLNSISLAGGSTLQINGPVIFNIAGVGQQTVVDFGGGNVSNTTWLPSDFVINYGGTNNINMGGGSAIYAVINAPNASISFAGGTQFYGQAIGRTIATTGANTRFYYDTSVNNHPVNNYTFYEVSLRELTY